VSPLTFSPVSDGGGSSDPELQMALLASCWLLLLLLTTFLLMVLNMTSSSSSIVSSELVDDATETGRLSDPELAELEPSVGPDVATLVPGATLSDGFWLQCLQQAGDLAGDEDFWAVLMTSSSCDVKPLGRFSTVCPVLPLVRGKLALRPPAEIAEFPPPPAEEGSGVLNDVALRSVWHSLVDWRGRAKGSL